MINKISEFTIARLHQAMTNRETIKREVPGAPWVSCTCPFAALVPQEMGDRLVGPEWASNATGEAKEAVVDFMAGFDNGPDPTHSNYIPGGPTEAYLQGRAFYDRYVAGK